MSEKTAKQRPSSRERNSSASAADKSKTLFDLEKSLEEAAKSDPKERDAKMQQIRDTLRKKVKATASRVDHVQAEFDQLNGALKEMRSLKSGDSVDQLFEQVKGLLKTINEKHNQLLGQKPDSGLEEKPVDSTDNKEPSSEETQAWLEKNFGPYLVSMIKPVETGTVSAFKYVFKKRSGESSEPEDAPALTLEQVIKFITKQAPGVPVDFLSREIALWVGSKMDTLSTAKLIIDEDPTQEEHELPIAQYEQLFGALFLRLYLRANRDGTFSIKKKPEEKFSKYNAIFLQELLKSKRGKIKEILPDSKTLDQRAFLNFVAKKVNALPKGEYLPPGATSSEPVVESNPTVTAPSSAAKPTEALPARVPLDDAGTSAAETEASGREIETVRDISGFITTNNTEDQLKILEVVVGNRPLPDRESDGTIASSISGEARRAYQRIANYLDSHRAFSESVKADAVQASAIIEIITNPRLKLAARQESLQEFLVTHTKPDTTLAKAAWIKAKKIVAIAGFGSEAGASAPEPEPEAAEAKLPGQVEFETATGVTVDLANKKITAPGRAPLDLSIPGLAFAAANPVKFYVGRSGVNVEFTYQPVTRKIKGVGREVIPSVVIEKETDQNFNLKYVAADTTNGQSVAAKEPAQALDWLENVAKKMIVESLVPAPETAEAKLPGQEAFEKAVGIGVSTEKKILTFPDGEFSFDLPGVDMADSEPVRFYNAPDGERVVQLHFKPVEIGDSRGQGPVQPYIGIQHKDNEFTLVTNTQMGQERRKFNTTKEVHQAINEFKTELLPAIAAAQELPLPPDPAVEAQKELESQAFAAELTNFTRNSTNRGAPELIAELNATMPEAYPGNPEGNALAFVHREGRTYVTFAQDSSRLTSLEVSFKKYFDIKSLSGDPITSAAQLEIVSPAILESVRSQTRPGAFEYKIIKPGVVKRRGEADPAPELNPDLAKGLEQFNPRIDVNVLNIGGVELNLQTETGLFQTLAKRGNEVSIQYRNANVADDNVVVGEIIIKKEPGGKFSVTETQQAASGASVTKEYSDLATAVAGISEANQNINQPFVEKPKSAPTAADVAAALSAPGFGRTLDAATGGASESEPAQPEVKKLVGSYEFDNTTRTVSFPGETGSVSLNVPELPYFYCVPNLDGGYGSKVDSFALKTDELSNEGYRLGLYSDADGKFIHYVLHELKNNETTGKVDDNWEKFPAPADGSPRPALEAFAALVKEKVAEAAKSKAEAAPAANVEFDFTPGSEKIICPDTGRSLDLQVEGFDIDRGASFDTEGAAGTGDRKLKIVWGTRNSEKPFERLICKYNQKGKKFTRVEPAPAMDFDSFTAMVTIGLLEMQRRPAEFKKEVAQINRQRIEKFAQDSGLSLENGLCQEGGNQFNLAIDGTSPEITYHKEGLSLRYNRSGSAANIFIEYGNVADNFKIDGWAPKSGEIPKASVSKDKLFDELLKIKNIIAKEYGVAESGVTSAAAARGSEPVRIVAPDALAVPRSPDTRTILPIPDAAPDTEPTAPDSPAEYDVASKEMTYLGQKIPVDLPFEVKKVISNKIPGSDKRELVLFSDPITSGDSKYVLAVQFVQNGKGIIESCHLVQDFSKVSPDADPPFSFVLEIEETIETVDKMTYALSKINKEIKAKHLVPDEDHHEEHHAAHPSRDIAQGPLEKAEWKFEKGKKSVVDLSCFELADLMKNVDLVTLYDQVGSAPQEAHKVLKNLFADEDAINKVSPNLLSSLRDQGYSFEDFKELWENKLADRVYAQVESAVALEVAAAVEKNIRFYEKVSGAQMLQQGVAWIGISLAGGLAAGYGAAALGASAAVAVTLGGTGAAAARRAAKSWISGAADWIKSLGKESAEAKRAGILTKRRDEVFADLRDSRKPSKRSENTRWKLGEQFKMGAWISQALRDETAALATEEEAAAHAKEQKDAEVVPDANTTHAVPDTAHPATEPEQQGTGLRARDDVNTYLFAEQAGKQLRKEAEKGGDAEVARLAQFEQLTNGLNHLQDVAGLQREQAETVYNKNPQVKSAITSVMGGELWAKDKSWGMRRLGDAITIGLGGLIGYGVSTASGHEILTRGLATGIGFAGIGIEKAAQSANKEVMAGFETNIQKTGDDIKALIKKVGRQEAVREWSFDDEADRKKIVEKNRYLTSLIYTGVFADKPNLEKAMRAITHEGRKYYTPEDFAAEAADMVELVQKRLTEMQVPPAAWKKVVYVVTAAAVGFVAGSALGITVGEWRAPDASITNMDTGVVKAVATGSGYQGGGQMENSYEPTGKGSGQAEPLDRGNQGRAPEPEPVTPEFSMRSFAAEHKLQPAQVDYLNRLTGKYPELNNQDSLDRLLEAGKRGSVDGSRSTGYAFQESAEADLVKFEEILKNGGPQRAADYLADRNFNSLDNKILGIKGKDYLGFATKYDEEVIRGGGHTASKLDNKLERAFAHDEQRDLAGYTSKKGGALTGVGKRVSFGKDATFLGADEVGNNKNFVVANAKESIYTKSAPQVSEAPPQPSPDLKLKASEVEAQQRAGTLVEKFNSQQIKGADIESHLPVNNVEGADHIVTIQPSDTPGIVDVLRGDGRLVQATVEVGVNGRPVLQPLGVGETRVATGGSGGAGGVGGESGAVNGRGVEAAPSAAVAAAAEPGRTGATEVTGAQTAGGRAVTGSREIVRTDANAQAAEKALDQNSDLAESDRQDALDNVAENYKELNWTDGEKAKFGNYVLQAKWQSEALGPQGKGLETLVKESGIADLSNPAAKQWLAEAKADLLARQAATVKIMDQGVNSKWSFTKITGALRREQMFGIERVVESGKGVVDSAANFQSYKNQVLLETLKQSYRPIEDQLDQQAAQR